MTTFSTEEKAVNILANDVRGNTSSMLSFEDFKMAYHGSLTTLVSIEGDKGGCIVSDEDAYNEYEHLVIEEPVSEYKNVFNHESML